MASLTTKKITDKIVLVSAPAQKALGSSFIRFQEHYESPEWRGKIFTEGQLRSWYSEKYGANTYERDWEGFNIPSSVLKPFIQGLFDPLSEGERELVSLFRYRTDDFYVIGAQEGSEALEHEICHGLFFTSNDYRKEVMDLLIQHEVLLEPIRVQLLKMMYHPIVVWDEVHAYLSANFDDVEEWLREDIDTFRLIHKSLRDIRDKHFVAARE